MTADPPQLDDKHLLISMFEQAHDAVFILTMDKCHYAVNQRAADLLGYTREELVGMSYRQVVVPEQQVMSENVFSQLMAGEDLAPFERKFRRKDGEIVPVEVSVEFIRDVHGQPVFIYSIVRDISARKQMQDQALHLALEKERSCILADFIIAASHEFRTPLANINTSLHIMRRLEDKDGREKRLDAIQGHVDLLSNLISRMLLLTRLERETQAPFAPISLYDVLYDAEVSEQRNLEAHSVTLVRRFGEVSPVCWGDSAALHVVFRELIDNAIKASEPGSVIEVSAEQRGGYALVSVRDWGIGISAEHLPYIFDRFYRVDKALNQRGFGLGLSIAKLIVDHHGGLFHVETDLGQGSTFQVILPLAPTLA